MEHLQILHQYAPQLHFDYVVLDTHSDGADELGSYLSTQGSELLRADLRSPEHPLHHDTKKLGQLFAHIALEKLVG